MTNWTGGPARRSVTSQRGARRSSFVTNPSIKPLKVRPKAPGVVGKGGGEACDIDVAQAVHGDARAKVITTATKIGRIEQRTSSCIQLGHERITSEQTAIEGAVEGIGRGREGGRAGEAREVGVPGAVHHDA